MKTNDHPRRVTFQVVRPMEWFMERIGRCIYRDRVWPSINPVHEPVKRGRKRTDSLPVVKTNYYISILIIDASHAQHLFQLQTQKPIFSDYSHQVVGWIKRSDEDENVAYRDRP